MNLALDRHQWQVLVKLARNYEYHKMLTTSLAEQLLASEELCCF
jgi:hypothetical protein